MKRVLIFLAKLVAGGCIALIVGALALILMVVRVVLTFLVGMSFLAALVGLGGWALTHDPNLWGMFWKSGLACLVVGLLLSGALWPLLSSLSSEPTPPPLRLLPRDDPFFDE